MSVSESKERPEDIAVLTAARTFWSYESGMSNWSEMCEHAVVNTKQRGLSVSTKDTYDKSVYPQDLAETRGTR